MIRAVCGLARIDRAPARLAPIVVLRADEIHARRTRSRRNVR
jgi:hypothetical protein